MATVPTATRPRAPSSDDSADITTKWRTCSTETTSRRCSNATDLDPDKIAALVAEEGELGQFVAGELDVDRVAKSVLALAC